MRLLVGCVSLLVSALIHAETLVVVQPLSQLLLKTTHSAPAQVINEEHAAISARISSVVEHLHVSVGDKVQAGQVLAELDCRDYKLARQQAESGLTALQAQIRLSRQQLERAEKLLKQKNASIELRDQRKAELDSLVAQRHGATASVSEAKLAIERCTRKAPFDGVVTEQMVSTGSLVNPGTMLFKLLSLSSQEVQAGLTSEQVSRLALAGEIYFLHNQTRFPLQVRTVIPLMDNRARTQQVRLSFTHQKAISGSSGRIQWLDTKGRLPARFVVSRNGQLGVMRVAQGIADFVALPNAIEGQAVEVDLEDGSLIIVEGQHAVEQDEPVTIAEKG
ncbi:MAG: efflux RND transporter periplasmic adaptor subunit [Neptuniibacter sp.]